MLYREIIAVCSQIHTKHSTQSQHHIVFWVLNLAVRKENSKLQKVNLKSCTTCKQLELELELELELIIMQIWKIILYEGLSAQSCVRIATQNPTGTSRNSTGTSRNPTCTSHNPLGTSRNPTVHHAIQQEHHVIQLVHHVIQQVHHVIKRQSCYFHRVLTAWKLQKWT